MAILLGLSSSVAAQTQGKTDGLELSQLTVTSGRGPLTSGLDLSVLLDDDRGILDLTANKDRAYAAYHFKLHPKLQGGPTGGLFFNTPLVGLRAVFTPINSLSLMGWYGEFFGTKGEPPGKPRFGFAFIGAYLDIRGMRVSYALQALEDLGRGINHLPSVEFATPINSSLEGLAAVTKNLTDGSWFFKVGATYHVP